MNQTPLQSPPQFYPAGSQPQMHPVGIWHCPMCGYAGPPTSSSKISTQGWIVFIFLFFVCILFCWVGLLMKETKQMCPRCFAKF